MLVNEAGNTNPNSAIQSGSYAAATSGAGKIGLPIMANGGQGYITGSTI